MKRMWTLPYEYGWRHLTLIGISLTVIGFTGVAYSSDPHVYERFFGEINPLIPMIPIVVLGIMLMLFLESRNWFKISVKENLRGVSYWLALAALFAVIAISIDLNSPLAADINISFPQSILFYPSIGFAAETLFHLLPLSLVLLVLGIFREGANRERAILIGIFIVAAVEPLFQTLTGISGPQPLWSNIFIGVNIYFFSLSQLLVFRQYGFIWMYATRLVYYLLWHIVWGHYRLEILF
jgi:hypothetical protein